MIRKVVNKNRGKYILRKCLLKYSRGSNFNIRVGVRINLVLNENNSVSRIFYYNRRFMVIKIEFWYKENNCGNLI